MRRENAATALVHPGAIDSPSRSDARRISAIGQRREWGQLAPHSCDEPGQQRRLRITLANQGDDVTASGRDIHLAVGIAEVASATEDPTGRPDRGIALLLHARLDTRD